MMMMIISGTTAVTGASLREYGSVTEVSENKVQVDSFPPAIW
jgi:hypothetical protein